MNQSTELKELMLQAYAAMAQGDTTFYDQRLAQTGDVLIIGTDPNEWWADRDTIRRVFAAQMQEINGLRVVPGNLLTTSWGEAGWAADSPTFHLPDGTQIPFRISVIFRKEAGGWKITHQHISIGVSNNAVVGQDLTVA